LINQSVNPPINKTFSNQMESNVNHYIATRYHSLTSEVNGKSKDLTYKIQMGGDTGGSLV